MRKQKVKEIDWRYEASGSFDEGCSYCGAPATTVDHVPPLDYVFRLTVPDNRLILKKYPACRECNSLAGALPHRTKKQRKRYLLQRYKKRYAKLLLAPKWDEDELSELGYSLQVHIRNMDDKTQWIRKRIQRLEE